MVGDEDVVTADCLSLLPQQELDFFKRIKTLRQHCSMDSHLVADLNEALSIQESLKSAVLSSHPIPTFSSFPEGFRRPPDRALH